jgi:hypothetical protein
MVKGSPHSSAMKKRYQSGDRYSPAALELMRQKRMRHFLKRADLIHKASFSYPSIDQQYINAKTSITVVCAEHGSFSATPDNHLSFQGGKCVPCGKRLKSAAAKAKYKVAYLDWFNSSLPEHLSLIEDFTDPNELHKFYCSIHKTYEQHTPVYLKNNKLWGCTKCAERATVASRQLDVSEIQNTAQPPDGIEILRLSRDGAMATKIVCKCEKHGVFQTTMGVIKDGRYWCNDCAAEKRGFAQQRLSRLIKDNQLGQDCHIVLLKVQVFELTSLKLGVTTRTIKERYKDAVSEVYEDIILPEVHAYTLEQRLLQHFKDQKDHRIKRLGVAYGNRWGGDTELFNFEIKDALLFQLRLQASKLL